MAEESDTIFFEKRGAVGWLYFSRPERMNALSSQTMRAVWAQLARVEADAGIKVLVFTGHGEAFCAGMDMAGLERANPLIARRRAREVQTLTSRIAEFSLPTIAAVNGVAMGVGLEICLACDLLVASRAARFAFPEVRLGMIPCGGGTQRLARLVGLRRAREMIFTGVVLDAVQAEDWGLANMVVGEEELVGAVDDMAERLVMGGRIALYQAKRCLNHSLDMEMGRGLDYETECFTTCFSSGEPAASLRRYAEPAADGARGREAGMEAAAERAQVAREGAAPEGSAGFGAGQAEAEREEEEGVEDLFE